MKIALIYGYAEGPRIANKFREVTISLGHELVMADKAEVIIAHSGGSYLVPVNNPAKLIMLVDVPYYDSHWSFVKKLSKRVGEEGLGIRSVSKFGWNNWYVISQFKRSLQMYRAVITGKFSGINDKKVVLIRNSQDVFGIIAQDKKEANKIKGVTKELPGTHDDIWVHPEAYIELAEKHA